MALAFKGKRVGRGAADHAGKSDSLGGLLDNFHVKPTRIPWEEKKAGYGLLPFLPLKSTNLLCWPFIHTNLTIIFLFLNLSCSVSPFHVPLIPPFESPLEKPGKTSPRVKAPCPPSWAGLLSLWLLSSFFHSSLFIFYLCFLVYS